MTATASSTVSPEEMDKFKAMAESWWDPVGKFKPLHSFNPLRIAHIRGHAAAHFDRDVTSMVPFTGLDLLDIGCGGGLLSEPMARMGFSVTGIDALERNVHVARTHAEGAGLAIDYRHATTEDLVAEGKTFDVVLNMEVVEHVSDPALFLSSSAALVRPGGIMVIATMNRTLKSYLLAKVGAEYILRWLPRGTHDWKKFLKPSELAAGLRGGGMTAREVRGMSYAPFTDDWRMTGDLDVNYIMVAAKAA
ncbi:MAG: bifunctional 2-polyprenyl-6-hydroxyphenol methylase/3-demethylubiquinol 3-O-methyltransferase UbiG [Alphaproteobacteria bacterium]|nr:bifunctional 2-polyprenyl-6-hydroxyphenol methylase/3-demethylubiquinol 3-O-methyltransferase UbiG [Alphaproteobacteria bacterium]MBF0128953.1 bifunctional 2-polyprenyl-6-hydroxyphenol methylase/3-demethylubiquinol 3-O-methyltransferase UbiG [Alphaproteobacteria bacterium]